MSQTCIQSEAARARGTQVTGLSEADFRLVGVNGLGDPWNSYAHSMAFYQGRLLIGTTRANLCMLKNRKPPDLAFWPIKCPAHVLELDVAARIYGYDPGLDEWRLITKSPLIVGKSGREIPREIGYRGMTIFQGLSDPEPALYVSTWSPTDGQGPLVVRTTDGESFLPASEPGLGFPDLSSFRGLVPFKGRVFLSPVGRTRDTLEAAKLPIVFECADPASGRWRAVSKPGFGDQNNVMIFEMTATDSFLYAGVMNIAQGFQIWKTAAEGNPPYRWTKVLERGAYRGKLNQGTAAMYVYQDAVYVGTGIQGGGYDRAYGVGPAAAELIRIFPDDSWDLLVGSPRKTPAGFKAPLSGMGPGFDSVFNGYFWRMCEHDGWLYVGTYDMAIFFKYTKLENLPPGLSTALRRIGVENLIQQSGGFDIWRSRDGAMWEPVTQNGFGNPYNYGVRTMVSTKFGLFVGAANPFGPEVGVKNGDRWEYVPNPRGGLEVWLGQRKVAEA